MSNDLRDAIAELQRNMRSVVLGKPEVVRMCLVALLAGEHVLLEDVPGVGKTLVGKALAKSLAGEFCRIQFTPDLLPSDIVGSSLFNSKTSEFAFKRGPIFANIVLADEINRATPRTQSALLEAMSDRQVSVDGVTHPLPRPFMVIATQNPFEFEGTYACRKASSTGSCCGSRWAIPIGRPSGRCWRRTARASRSSSCKPVLCCPQIVALQQAVRQVAVEDRSTTTCWTSSEATRQCEELHVGVSTRGALSLYRAAQASALVAGRSFVVPGRRQAADAAGAGAPRRDQGLRPRRRPGSGRVVIQRLVEEVPVPT